MKTELNLNCGFVLKLISIGKGSANEWLTEYLSQCMTLFGRNMLLSTNSIPS